MTLKFVVIFMEIKFQLNDPVVVLIVWIVDGYSFIPFFWLQTRCKSTF
jgi:hypothetical protein